MKQLVGWIGIGALLIGCGDDSRPDVELQDPDVEAGGRRAAAGGGGEGGDTAAGAAGTAGAAGKTSGSTTGSAGTPSAGGMGGEATAPGGAGGAAGGAGVAGAAGATEIPAPTVAIAFPLDLAHPDDGQVLVDSVEVLCDAVAAEGSEPIDTTSVTIDLLDAAGEVLETVVASQGDVEGQFAASIVVANYESGPVSLQCTASTGGAEPLTGADSIGQFIDHGPIITPIVPEADEALVARDVLMQFLIEPDSLADGDTGAAVSSTLLEVDGQEFPLTLSVNENVYEALVPFEDTSVFDPMPVGDDVGVRVSASNARSPENVEAVVPYTFILDGSGPQITINSPAELAVVGGNVVLDFDVIDDFSGVDSDSIRVIVNDAEADRYDPQSTEWAVSGSTYQFRFDSAAVEGSLVQLTVNITAMDTAGNISETASRVYYRDYQPPYVSLDPPEVRDVTRSGETVYCTRPFDPLGDAASDLDIFGLAPVFRAFVLERTNSIEDSPGVLFYSLTDEARVQLFLETEPFAGEPLVIDTNGDEVCDNVNTEGRDLPQQELVAISPKGDLSTDDEDSLVRAEEPVLPEGEGVYCQPNSGTNLTLCNGTSDMGRATAQRIGGVDRPVVFATGVSDAGGGAACAGVYWELTTFLRDEAGEVEDGWICLAALAYDTVDNRGVSEPLRVCIDSSLDPDTPDCALGLEDPPDCTDGCTRQEELRHGERLLYFP